MFDENEINQHKRRNRKRRRLGMRSPKCGQCGETDPLALVTRTTCYECTAKANGQVPIENHHLAGRQNDPFTLSVPGNDHQILSDSQRDWPYETLRNPTGDPLVKIAATLRGWLDLLTVAIKRILGWIPEFLERVARYLVKALGPDWWTQI